MQLAELEVELRTELDATRRVAGSHLAEAAIGKCAVDASEAFVVERIEELSAELEVVALMEGDVLDGRQIPVVVTRAEQAAIAFAAEVVEGRGKRRCGEPLRRRSWSSAPERSDPDAAN